MGQDLGEGDRDFVEEMMEEGEQSDEVVTELKDVSDISQMGDDVYVSKMEGFENSTKNGHLTEVR